MIFILNRNVKYGYTFHKFLKPWSKENAVSNFPNQFIGLTLVLLMAMDWSVVAAAISSLLQFLWLLSPKGSTPCNGIGAELGCDAIIECWVESFEKRLFLRFGLTFAIMKYFNYDFTPSKLFISICFSMAFCKLYVRLHQISSVAKSDHAS